MSCEWSENDEKMLKDYIAETTAMLQAAGFMHIKVDDNQSPPGSDIHEMGGVRMGHDPKTSLLNKWNQMHLCRNVFVTDGPRMTPTVSQNPTLTFMALTARAVEPAPWKS